MGEEKEKRKKTTIPNISTLYDITFEVRSWIIVNNKLKLMNTF